MQLRILSMTAASFAVLAIAGCAGTPPPGEQAQADQCAVTGSNLGNHHCSTSELFQSKSASEAGVALSKGPLHAQAGPTVGPQTGSGGGL